MLGFFTSPSAEQESKVSFEFEMIADPDRVARDFHAELLHGHDGRFAADLLW